MELTTFIDRLPGLVWRASWQASVLVLLVLAAQWLCGRRLAPKWRYALWLLVVVRLLLPVTPPSRWSLFNYGTVEHVSAPEFDWWMGAETGERALADSPEAPAVARPPSADRSNAFAPISGDRPDQKPKPASESIIRATVIFLRRNLGSIWFLGVLVLSTRLAWGNYLFELQLRRRRPIAEPAVLALFEECRQTMDVRRPLTLLEAPELDGPALFGCFRLKLLLPEKMIEAFSPAELRHVFLHELAHIRRWDAAVNWLTTILQTLHWFNPVLWFAFHRMRADREVACDELALARANEAESKPYGQTVLKVLEGFTGPTAIPGLVGILEDKTQIKRRIHMIAQFKKNSAWPVLATVVLMGLGLVSLTDAQTKRGAEKLSESSLEGKTPRDASKAGNSVLQRPSAPGLTLRKVMELPYDLVTPQHIAPDGRSLVGLSRGPRFGDGPPVVLDLTTGSMRRLEAPTLSFVRFSPDGKRISIWRRDELQLLDLETGKISQTYRNEAIRYTTAVNWSPDGKSVLAVWSKTNGADVIALVSIRNGEARELKTFETNSYPPNCLFSPDGRWIAYDFRYWAPKERGGEDIRLMAVDGSGDVPLGDHPAEDYLLGWAPSGDRILFASNRRGSWDAYTIRVHDGKTVSEPELLKEGIGKVKELGFTVAGAFYYSVETRATDVFVAELDPMNGKARGKPRKVPGSEGKNRYPSWSPDGRYLAYTSPREISPSDNTPDGVIGVFDVETGTVREIVPDAGRVSAPRWAPGGRSLFAISWALSKRLVYRIDGDSGKSTTIAEGVGAIYNTPMWSWAPDGKTFYQQRGLTNITRWNVDSGDKQEILIPRNSFTAVLSPDGQQFAFSVTATNSGTFVRTIYVMAVSGGDSRPVVILRGVDAMDLTFLPDQGLGWTPDSRCVLFVKGNANNSSMRSLWRVPIAGGESESLGLEMDELREPVISSDGRRIAFTAGGRKNELWVMENFLPKDKVAAK